MNIRLITILIFLSNTLLAIGLFAPCMHIEPSYGEFDTLVRLVHPKLGEATNLSIIGGIQILYADGKYFLSIILFIFSVIFPLWKLSILWQNILVVRAGGLVTRSLKTIEKLGKFSMLDIFVIAILVMVLKGLPGGTEIQIGWGVFSFATSILLSLPLPQLIEKVHS